MSETIVAPTAHRRLIIGGLLYPGMDQLDLTGPFEVLSRLPGASFVVLGKNLSPVRDVNGLLLTPQQTLADSPPLDVLVVPGGHGQQELMEDDEVLAFIRQQAAGARFVLSVCTGALVCGAAGLLRDVRATTHWSAFDLLPWFGAIPVAERVVVDGKIVTAAGVTAGIDGALKVAALLCGDDVAQQIQLAIEYDPAPPFDSGTPQSAPADIVAAARERVRELTAARLATARRVAAKLGIAPLDETLVAETSVDEAPPAQAPPRRLLLADESPEVAQAAQRLLASHGCLVDCVQTGAAAIELAERTHYDAVLIDARLPDMTGPECLERIRATRPDIPAILLTAFGYDSSLVTNAGGLRRDAVLYKPFRPDMLVAAIDKCAPPPADTAEETEPPRVGTGTVTLDAEPSAQGGRTMQLDRVRAPRVDVASGTISAAEPGGDKSPLVDENVQFTVYRPRVVVPDKWYPLLAFAHLSEKPADAAADDPDPVEEVQKQARILLAAQADQYHDVTQDSRLAVPREGELTFVPEIEGFTFNPPRRTFLWTETVHREEFRLKAGAALQGKTARGRLTVFLGSIVLADVSLSIKVDAQAPAALAAQPPVEAASARPYRKIFASYSHRDLPIVTQFERFARMLGDRYLRDWTELRAGEVWDDRLLEMIREADVFQLFWSTNAMNSPYVKRECEYALSLDRAGFIRPTYWEHPLPQDPARGLPSEPLARLHFQQLPPPGEGETAAAHTLPGTSTPGSATIDTGTREFAPVSPEQTSEPAAPARRPGAGSVLSGPVTVDATPVPPEASPDAKTWTGEPVVVPPSPPQPSASDSTSDQPADSLRDMLQKAPRRSGDLAMWPSDEDYRLESPHEAARRQLRERMSRPDPESSWRKAPAEAPAAPRKTGWSPIKLMVVAAAAGVAFFIARYACNLFLAR